MKNNMKERGGGSSKKPGGGAVDTSLIESGGLCLLRSIFFSITLFKIDPSVCYLEALRESYLFF